MQQARRHQGGGPGTMTNSSRVHAPARRRRQMPPAAALARLQTDGRVKGAARHRASAQRSFSSTVTTDLLFATITCTQAATAAPIDKKMGGDRSPASCSLAAACRPATPAPTTTTSACPCCAAALTTADRRAARCCGLLACVKGRRGSLAAGQRASGAARDCWATTTAVAIVANRNGWPLLAVRTRRRWARALSPCKPLR